MQWGDSKNKRAATVSGSGPSSYLFPRSRLEQRDGIHRRTRCRLERQRLDDEHERVSLDLLNIDREIVQIHVIHERHAEGYHRHGVDRKTLALDLCAVLAAV